MTPFQPSALIDLNGAWSFSPATGGETNSLQFPGDVHSGLLALGKIPDPYYGLNEDKVNRVGETDWVVARSFEVNEAFLA